MSFDKEQFDAQYKQHWFWCCGKTDDYDFNYFIDFNYKGTITILRAPGGGQLQNVTFVSRIIWGADNQHFFGPEYAWMIKVISIPIHFGCDLVRRAKGAAREKIGVFYAWYTWGNERMNSYRGRKNVCKPLQIRE